MYLPPRRHRRSKFATVLLVVGGAIALIAAVGLILGIVAGAPFLLFRTGG